MWETYQEEYLKRNGQIISFEDYVSKAFEDKLMFKKDDTGDHG